MGDALNEGYPGDGEGPVREVTLTAFHIDATAVTNAAFAAFVKATGWRTTAEEAGCSAVFYSSYQGPAGNILGRPALTPWWLTIAGATWRTPEGPGSDVTRRQNHPVVHISHTDALAYATWAGKRLLSEAEWERAARGGLERARYPWGDELQPRGRAMANLFEGSFPNGSAAPGGVSSTVPVKSYAPNGFGLYQMAGNTWEWCSDWFSPNHDATPTNPSGPDEGESRVLRGGSFLCHDSYCNRYRVAARSSAPPDSTSGNLGFRCGNDAAPASPKVS